MGIWWSGSLNRQLLDRGFVVDYGTGGEPNVLFSKGDYNVTTGQGTKNNPVFYADFWGDWREEMVYVTPGLYGTAYFHYPTLKLSIVSVL